MARRELNEKIGILVIASTRTATHAVMWQLNDCQKQWAGKEKLLRMCYSVLMCGKIINL